MKKISDEPDSLKKLEIFYEYARELRDSIKMLDFMEYISGETRTLVSMDVCSNMFESGKYTLGEIRSVLPWLHISDIYGLSKMLGIEIQTTDKEMKEVKAEYHKTRRPIVLKEIFGEESK